MFIKKLALAAFTAIGLLGTAQAQSIDDIIARKKLLVAIDTTYAPYGTIDANMKPDGFEVALAGLMAKALNVQLEVVPVNTANRLPFLLTNKADITLSTLTVTAQRASQVMFTIPYAGLKFELIASKTRKISGPEDLKGLKVGVIRGGAADPQLTAVAPKDTQIVRLDDVAGCVQALLSGQVDAIAEGWLIPGQMNKAKGEDAFESKFTFSEAHYAIAVRKGSFDLLQWLNTFIYTVKQNGQLAGLHQQYLNLPLPSLPTY
ncbi:transporter substrate-binding domain-containing protein (plasmid) [Bosea sp. F3-2]|uniref:transporter substrate-binding domain-containing protein n=1 Tax=Bosea sp. F3-2 TaxID=2599640 RepID=UPI0011EC50BA|nr:transporter substrate-binding domain-containing protein [Bosea sp. F3-2]QEL27317.1 transporter substrate-binding domain-containing protein [Bosea sp. F3-2]